MESCNCETHGYCGKCKGMLKSLFGVLILINLLVWPRWTGVDGWIGFLGIVLIFTGVAKSFAPSCGCPHDGSVKTEAPAPHHKKK